MDDEDCTFDQGSLLLSRIVIVVLGLVFPGWRWRSDQPRGVWTGVWPGVLSHTYQMLLQLTDAN